MASAAGGGEVASAVPESENEAEAADAETHPTEWSDVGQIPSPEAYAALKLQIQVVRGCVVCVQPIQPTTTALTARRDSCHIFDLETNVWFVKEACQRIRYR